MTSRMGGSPRVVAAALLLVAAGCAEAGDEGPEPASAPARRPPTAGRVPAGRARAERPGGRAPAAAPPTAPSTPAPAFSFDGSVPAPSLRNTGSDYAAVFASLDAYRKWLVGHRPDPALMAPAYAPGSWIQARIARDLRLLAESGLRLVDVDQWVEGEVQRAAGDVVTLTVREHLRAVRLVDARGETVDEQPRGPVLRYSAVLVRDAAGRWRIGELTPLLDGVQVRL